MAAVHLQSTVAPDGTLTVRGLPSLAGHKVDVVVRDRDAVPDDGNRYPLRGLPIEYKAPFDSVAEDDWDALNPK
ncbi:MAG: hypothetical protein NTW86_31340 [Candidatus Sumerlaeota bacterium]|nr:hypothetical protein [Candidatus Sumerlaeota bacterium]